MKTLGPEVAVFLLLSAGCAPSPRQEGGFRTEGDAEAARAAAPPRAGEPAAAPLRPAATAPDGGETVLISLDVKDQDLHELLSRLSKQVGVNIVADPEMKEQVTLTLDRVPWRQALDLIALRTHSQIIEESERLVRLTQPPSINMEFHDADIKVVLALLAAQAGTSIVMPADMREKITLSLREVPWREALEAVAKTAGYVVVYEGTGGPSGSYRLLR